MADDTVPADISQGLDKDLYSRQIGTYGMETMRKLIGLRVMIWGLGGAGFEVAKNIILAGPKCVYVYDPNIVQARDLGTNFFLNKFHIGKTARADASLPQLRGLNEYVKVDVIHSINNLEELPEFDVVVICEVDPNLWIDLNNFCRSNTERPVGFIIAACLGLAGFIFVDFGDKFRCFDIDGEEPKSAIVAGITHETVATVHLHTDKRIPFQTDDYVTFKEVQGMVEINNMPPVRLRVTGTNSFTIGDTTQYTPYEREGIVTQVKLPTEIHFSPLSSFINNLSYDSNCNLVLSDSLQFGRSEQLYIACIALFAYHMNHNCLPPIKSDLAFEEVKAAAQAAWKKRYESSSDQDAKLDEDILRNVTYFAACNICPMAAYIGGIAAQEVVKFTGKYNPIHQFLLVDALEAVPKEEVKDWQSLGCRYDDQIAIWGAEFQYKLAKSKLFLVGAGALGCEFLKSFALMGIGCMPDGGICVTDMDQIEMSNLNRQFLFRKEHIGALKSKTAADAAKAVNPNLNVIASDLKVEEQTENIFDDEFWNSRDIIINALDNIKSRQYVDSRCVWYNKSLIESGTLGTKANVQVILAGRTQSYNDSQDPPEESIPLCTLKHFPHAIEHTIQWSRDLFEGLFVNGPQAAEKFLKSPKDFLKPSSADGTPAVLRENLERIYDMLSRCLYSNTFEKCVEKACLIFQEYFNNQILQLLHNFPPNHVTTAGQLFWSGPKRQPSALELETTDQLVIRFIMATANLYAEIQGLEKCEDAERVIQAMSNVSVPQFKPRQLSIKVDDSDPTVEGAGDDEVAIDRLRRQLLNLENMGNLSIKPIVFEKDDDKNFHIEFIHSCANLRARNYRIAECSFEKSKMIAGKIIPAIATTTTVATGLACFEIVKFLWDANQPLENFRNGFINLAIPMWLFSEPLEPLKTIDKDYDPVSCGPVKARPNGFTTWDKLQITIENGTLGQLLENLQKEFSMEVSIVSSGSTCLYNSFLPKQKLQRLNKPLKELYEEITKTTIPPKRSYVIVDVSGNDIDTGVDLIIPVIQYNFRK